MTLCLQPPRNSLSIPGDVTNDTMQGVAMNRSMPRMPLRDMMLGCC